MSENPASAPSHHRPLAALLSIFLPLAVMARLGQDGNWDLRNYHLYNAHAWLHGRYAIDVAPAQLQSWHNPLLDLPLYLLQRAGAHGALIGAWLTLPMMVALYLLLRLPDRLGAPLRPLAMVALAVLAVSGAAAFSAIGSSFNDAFVAAGILGSLGLLLAPPASEGSLKTIVVAGLLAGTTAGLKLTALPYCIGLACALACLAPGRQLPARLMALLVGGLLGALLSYGAWAWSLWQAHGNPVFPYFNQIFQSPDAAFEAYADERFRAASWADAALAPLRLMTESLRYSEIPLRDPRLFLGCVAFPLLAFFSFRVGSDRHARAARTSLALAIFYFVCLGFWTLQSGVYRYTLPLEMLACLAVVGLLQGLPGKAAVVSLAAVALLVPGQTTRPDWGHLRFSRPMLDISMPALSANALVVTGGWAPVGYLALALPDTVPMVSISNNFMRPDLCTGLQARAEWRIRDHAGPMYFLRSDDPSADTALRLAEQYYGLKIDGSCLPVPSTLGQASLCPMQRTFTRPTCPVPSAPAGR